MMPWMKRTEDELISAYIDGKLDDSNRQSFEARIDADPALRKRVETTRLLVQAARRTPAVTPPRNFTLPRPAAARRRDASSSRLGWRLGSALAAAVFVIAIGLDAIGVGQLAQSPALSVPPAPRVAQSLAAKAPAPTENSAQDSASGAAANHSTAATAAPLATEAPAATAAPAPTRSFAAAARVQVTPTELMHMTAVDTSTVTADILPAVKAVTVTGTPEIAPSPLLREPSATLTPEAAAPHALALQAPYGITATVESTIEAPAEPIITTQAVPLLQNVDLLRIAALIALVAAIVAGILGWARR